MIGAHRDQTAVAGHISRTIGWRHLFGQSGLHGRGQKDGVDRDGSKVFDRGWAANGTNWCALSASWFAQPRAAQKQAYGRTRRLPTPPTSPSIAHGAVIVNVMGNAQPASVAGASDAQAMATRRYSETLCDSV